MTRLTLAALAAAEKAFNTVAGEALQRYAWAFYLDPPYAGPVLQTKPAVEPRGVWIDDPKERT